MPGNTNVQIRHDAIVVAVSYTLRVFSECQACGAIVNDEDRHTKFHEDISHTAEPPEYLEVEIREVDEE